MLMFVIRETSKVDGPQRSLYLNRAGQVREASDAVENASLPLGPSFSARHFALEARAPEDAGPVAR